MLKIQRASAGSGKTYTLAKTFILNLIAYKTPEGKWYIRNEKQIEDALTHLLAITFTNKATNEMKKRIIENLALLSRAEFLDDNQIQTSNIPYLQEIHDLTGVPFRRIGKASSDGLRIVLNNFSNFKISTIDSFFQEILRTFAYETNLNSNYQLEIDSTYVTEAALDSAIQEIDSRPYNMKLASFWFKTIMGMEAKKSQRWNLFNKSNASRSIYSRIKKALSQLETEDYKDIKDSLDHFYSEEANRLLLIDFFSQLRALGLKEREYHLKLIKSLGEKIEKIISENNHSTENLNRYFPSHLVKIKNLDIDDKVGFSFDSILKAQTVFKSKSKIKDTLLDQIAMEFYTELEKWEDSYQNSYYKNWRIYGELLPYLGLLLEIRIFLSDILEKNNMIQLSDTNYILKKIIGNADAPFVYERLGNRIDHYLIDEFQDTSRMQWDILYPLLTEGVGKKKESLIIGDPKQSIYRFRNADHTLITDVVPKSFPHHIPAGFSNEDNTNWRSHTNIIKFNNYIFKSLAEGVALLSQNKGGDFESFLKLYSNVVQYPANKEGKGYIEIRTLKKPVGTEFQSDIQEEENSNVEGKSWFDEAALSQIGPLLSSLIARGYRKKDIAILVNTNKKGEEVVKYLIGYNESLNENQPEIDFISEESLLTSSSPVVATVIDVLTKLASPSKYSACPGNENFGKRVYLDWIDVKMEYNIFASRYKELPRAEILSKFLKEYDFNEPIDAVIAGLSNPTLTALVDTILQIFIAESEMEKESIYIASLQDIVAEYSINHHNDPASFLEWWNVKGKYVSVSSPSGSDAVQIMTIHKSKGLEFKCVILPFVSDNFSSGIQKEEWRWVKPQFIENLPELPILPVKTSSVLLGSSHQELFIRYQDQVLTDKLNMYYVAFTRARNELYIFSPESKAKNPSTINDFLTFILSGKFQPMGIKEEERDFLLDVCEVDYNDGNGRFSLGNPFDKQEIEEENKKEEEKSQGGIETQTKYITNYKINTKRPKLRSLATKSPIEI